MDRYLGNIWFACSNETIENLYCPRDFSGYRTWHCRIDGNFEPPDPVLTSTMCCGNDQDPDFDDDDGWETRVCEDPAKGLFACDGSSAWLRCADGNGFEEYECKEGLFIKNNTVCPCCRMCNGMDQFDNKWTGYPNSEMVQDVLCPIGSPHRRANVSLWCNEDGTFNSAGPNYTNCCTCDGPSCRETWGGMRFYACDGETATTRCSYCNSGYAYWSCSDIHFVNVSPNSNECNCWLNQADGMVRN